MATRLDLLRQALRDERSGRGGVRFALPSQPERDYLRGGHSVESVVGIGGSPSCGGRTTLELPAVLDDIARREPARLDRTAFNRHVIAGHATAGPGMFIAALRRHQHHRGIDVPFDEHDLIVQITR